MGRRSTVKPGNSGFGQWLRRGRAALVDHCHDPGPGGGWPLWLAWSVAASDRDRAADRLGRILASATGRPGADVVPAGSGAGPPGGQGIDPPLGAGGVAVFLVVCCLPAGFSIPTASNPARLYIGFMLTTTTYLVLLLAAVPQHLEPSERHQEPHDLHRGHQAGAGQRDRVGPDPRFLIVGTGPVRHGADELRVRGPRGLSHTHVWSWRTWCPTTPTAAGKKAGGWKGSPPRARASARHGARRRGRPCPGGNVQRHWHTLTIDKARRGPHGRATVETGAGGRTVLGPRADLRQTALPGHPRQGTRPRKDQRRRRVDLSQLYRRGHAGGRHLGLRGHQREGRFPDGLPWS